MKRMRRSLYSYFNKSNVWAPTRKRETYTYPDYKNEISPPCTCVNLYQAEKPF